MKTRLLPLLAALLAAVCPVRAATVNWTTSTVSGPADVNTAGTLFGAMNVGDAANARTVNGVTFATDPGGAGTLTLGSGTVAFTNLGTTFNAFWPTANPGGDAAYGAALDAGRYGASGSGTVTLGGLTVGRKYLVQLWITDTRAASNARVRTVDGVSTTSGGPNIATGTFVADAATQVITVDDGAATFGPQVNLLQVRDVPVRWTTSTVSGPSDVSTAGILVGAMNVGSAPADTAAVNGVTFAADPGGAGALALGAGSVTVTFGNLGSTNDTFWNLADPGGSAPYGLALDSGRWQSGPATGTITLGGLAAGRKYLVQLWIADTRAGANARVRTVDDTATNSGGPNIATGTFIAEAATQVITLADVASYGPQVNMLQVRNLTVANTNDTGAGSLRQAIADAAAIPGADAIVFGPGLSGQTITLSSEIVINDTADVTLDASPLANGLTINGGAGTNRILSLSSGSNVTLRGLNFTGGEGKGAALSGDGGAILVQGALTVEDCQFQQNAVGGSGGAIAAVSPGSLTVTRCTFSDNQSTAASGEVGGAIITSAPTTISQSTFTGNSAPQGGAVYSGSSASLTISQCTFTGNSAATGGAVQCAGSGTAALTHVTIAGNQATATGVSGGGLRVARAVSLAYCIVAGNSSAGAADDIENQSALTYSGVNLVQTVVTSGTGTVSGPAPLTGAPQLAALGDHGGPAETRPPLSTSPALNAATGSTITTDQRGSAVSGVPDLGACEHSISIAVLPDQTITEDAAQADRTFSCVIDSVSYTSPVPAFNFTRSNATLVTAINLLGTNPNRAVRVVLAPNASGTSTVTVRVTQGSDVATRSFLLTVTPVNDAPVFTKGADVSAGMNAAPVTAAGWATGIDDGDAESAQALSFLVTNDNNALFSAQPAIAANGTLTFTPAPWQTGTATVTVQLQDDGSAVSPNVNLSAAQTFTITVASTTLTVTRAEDTGAGSLRVQIAAALAASGAHRIVFDASLSGQTITLASGITISDTNNADVLSIDASSLPAGLTINSAGTDRIFSLYNNDRAALRGLTLTGGNIVARGAGYGGAILTGSGSNLTLTLCTLLGNLGDYGGAIYGDGALTLTQCRLSGNSAVYAGGAILGNGALTMVQCTLSGNSVSSAGGSGGAIASQGALDLRQCTLSGNSVFLNGKGGAIYRSSTGGGTLTHCSISGNSAGPPGSGNGGAIYNDAGAMTLANCLIAANTALSGPDIRLAAGTLNRSGVNLIGNNDTVSTQFPAGTPNANGDLAGSSATPVGAKIAPLGNYGGPTQTRPPVFGSLAIDAAAGSTITTDQRGIAVSGVPDIGASENIVPAISDIAALTVSEDSTPAARTVAFTVGDAPGYPGTPSLTATSNNTALVPSYTFGGSGANRTVLLNVPADASGTAVITVRYSNGMVEVQDNFILTVTAVNDAPTLAAISDLTISEDAAQQTINLTGIGTGAPNEAQTLTVTATSSNTALIPNPAVAYTSPQAAGTLTFTPVANAHGTAVITVITVTVSDGVDTTQDTFTVTVTPAADTPSVTNTTTNEDTQSTTGLVLSRNAADGAEVTHFKVTGITNGTLYRNNGTTEIPSGSFITVSLGAAGLKFTPAANFNGTGSFVIQASTSSGDAGLGGSPVTASITVNSVNDAPVLTAIPEPAAIDEDAPQQTINLTGIGTGAANETQTLTITATSDNTTLIPHPTVTYTSPDAAGTLTFTPVANAFGSAIIAVSVSDGQAANSTVTRIFMVMVNPVNDAPSFTKGADQSVAMNSAQTVVTGWATGMSIGPANEIGQTFTGFTVTNDNNTLFSAQPAIAADGTLSFTPAAWKNGVATVTVRLQDSGNSVAPSVNTSAPQSFTITVTSGTPFDAWKLAQFGPDVTNPAIAGNTADADSDGLDTLHEYAAGSNPLGYTPTPLTATAAPGGGMVFEFPWNPQATDLRYHLQESSDIGTWSDLYQNDRPASQITRAPGVTSTENVTTGIITVTVPASTGARSFWRLTIEQP